MTVILPAVDVSRGRCVRLTRGKIEEAKVYYEDPLEAARLWEGIGAEALHIIDLDAAIGIGENVEAIKRIIKAVGIPAEVGGGIRSVARAKEYADAGACRVIFGTAALELKFIMEAMRTIGRERVMAAVDHLMGRVAVKGWQEMAQID
ncbi:MAG TPA: HisA/HisF-related TIM barrel protein, partial [Candidatus Methanomethylicus sp.]|nr:HisA/HisF-related TIM barrel protein [Candidatus Methanomethylicus sp.]